jgi:transposase
MARSRVGQPPYDPRMMTKVLVYGYCVGVFSSRRIERRLIEDVGFRVLAASNALNFRTIADFRKLHLATLAGLFEEMLKIELEGGGSLSFKVSDKGGVSVYGLGRFPATRR